MKKILILGFFVYSSTLAQNPKEVPLDSKIENVTVFLNGAQVTRTAKTSLESGKTVLVFKGISQQIDKNSIQVKGSGKFTVNSIVHQLNNKREQTRQDEIARLGNQKETFEDKIKSLRNSLTVYKREEEMLVKNQSVAGTSTGLKIADFKEAIEFQRVRMQEVMNKQLEIEREIAKVEKDIRKVNQQLTVITIAKDQTTSDILVTISSKETIPNTAFSLSYFVKDALWKPTYDVRVDQISEPLNLVYKANVYQFSGEDWKEVKLRLSTADPNQNGTPPVLENWYWGKINNYSSYFKDKGTAPEIITEVSGQVTDGKGQSIPGVSVQLKGSSLGTVSDADGFYHLNIPPNSTLRMLTFSSVGYSSHDEYIRNNKVDVSLTESTNQLQEVVVAGYGAERKFSSAATGISIKKGGSMPIQIEEKEAPTSQSFDILMPYTIPSDGKVYTVDIKEENIPAVYEYYAVPKIDRDAFLTAHVLNWEKYKLLEGDINLYFEGTFLGKSTLSLPNSDTLDFALGRDKNVLISRVKQKEFTKKQFIGNSKTDQLAYEIVVRNTKNKAINLTLDDQFPLTNNKEIDVYNKEAKEAEINNETGKITWKISLDPAKEKKVNFSYSVKYPKSGFIERAD